MKVSNETKIGALTVIAITLLILGFNFLKGKNLIEKKATIYIAFEKVNGLNMADMIKINGLKVGGVEDMQETDADLSGIIVAFPLFLMFTLSPFINNLRGITKVFFFS